MKPLSTPHRTETKKSEADQAEGRGFGHRLGLGYELCNEAKRIGSATGRDWIIGGNQA
jgi:hypothetical protein